MKKSLVVTLALVFVLGIAGTAFAANPFSDVPANHWAYAAVSKLAQEGIVSGYGDGRFAGNRTITRYEMAQIVAKALANGGGSAAAKAQLQKLAAEYADELDSLGVRVAKLEKSSDNVKITGEARFANYAYDKDVHGDNSQLRTRLYLSGQVNDKWKYVGMLENKHDLETNGGNGQSISLRRAWVEGKIGAVGVIAGNYNYIPMYGTVLDDDFKGLILSYNTGKFDIELFAGRPSTNLYGINDVPSIGDVRFSNYTVYGTNLRFGISDDFNIRGAYYHVDASDLSILAATPFADVSDSANIFEIGADYAFSDKFSMWAEFIRGDDMGADFDKNGWAAGVQYGATDKNKPGSWQLTGAYYDVPSGGYVAMTTEFSPADWGGDLISERGMKGWTVGASYMAAKNIDLNVEYFDMKSQGEVHGEKTKGKLLWSYVRFYF